MASTAAYTVRYAGGSDDGKTRTFNSAVLDMLGMEMVEPSEAWQQANRKGEKVDEAKMIYNVYRYDDHVSENNVVFFRFVKSYNQTEYRDHCRMNGLGRLTQ